MLALRGLNGYGSGSRFFVVLNFLNLDQDDLNSQDSQFIDFHPLLHGLHLPSFGMVANRAPFLLSAVGRCQPLSSIPL